MRLYKTRLLPLVIVGTLSSTMGCAFAYTHNAEQSRHQSCTPFAAQTYQTPYGQRLKKLNLTTEQQQKVQAIVQNARHEAKPLKRDLQKSHFDYKQAITADHYQQETINHLAKQQGEDITQLLSLKGKTQNAIKNILNDDQRLMFEKMQAKQQHRPSFYKG